MSALLETRTREFWRASSRLRGRPGGAIAAHTACLYLSGIVSHEPSGHLRDAATGALIGWGVFPKGYGRTPCDPGGGRAA